VIARAKLREHSPCQSETSRRGYGREAGREARTKESEGNGKPVENTRPRYFRQNCADIVCDSECPIPEKESAMPWPFLFLFGTKVFGHVATTAATKAAATAGTKGAASAGAKGTAGKSSSSLNLPSGTKSVAKEFIKRLSREKVSDDDDRDGDDRDDDKKK
jgi:hypothetical protein